MTFIQAIKKYKIMTIGGMIYVFLFLADPDKASRALENSIYYFIEMIEILPVIFMLTAAIEALIPKELIIRHLGEKSGLNGKLLSIVLGSVSAGPVYAAFPVCKMLLSKGASVANVVIILSSWAVIKLPMLANEAKFLGPSFMGMRWLLTVIAILLMAAIIEKLVDKKEFDTLMLHEEGNTF